MLKLLPAAAGLMVIASLASCAEDNWDTYRDWREANQDWYTAQAYRTDSDGKPYYRQLSPDWNKNSGVLIHYLNDRALTEGNLSPLQTSYVKVNYRLELYNGVAVDSGTAFVSQPAQLIPGWQVALNDMRVGDTCEVIVPYTQGYGAGGSTNIDPYSMLKFGIRLVDIDRYEVPLY